MIMRMNGVKNSKAINLDTETLFEGVDLPTDEEVRQETFRAKISENTKLQMENQGQRDRIREQMKEQIQNSEFQRKRLIAFKNEITQKKRQEKITQYLFIGTNILTGEIISVSGAKEMKKYNLDYGHVSRCANGDRKSHKGYTWRREPLKPE